MSRINKTNDKLVTQETKGITIAQISLLTA